MALVCGAAYGGGVSQAWGGVYRWSGVLVDGGRPMHSGHVLWMTVWPSISLALDRTVDLWFTGRSGLTFTKLASR
jgi:hypothetical protein